MNDHNVIIEKIANLATQKGSITFSDIDEVLPTEFNLEELDDLISSLTEMGITVGDEPIKKTFNAPNNKRDIRLQDSLHHTLENNKSDKNILINSHLNLVYDIVNEHRKSKPHTMPHNDLVQEGYLGLLSAATDYHSDGKDSFSTFASKRIKVFIEKAIKNEQTQNPFGDNISDFVYSDKEHEYIKYWRKEQNQDPYEQTQNPFRDNMPYFVYSDKEHEYIKYWRDEEDIYTSEVSDQSESTDKDNSELTVTSISKIQLPHIPDLKNVNPTLTSNDTSLLVEKRNIDNNKNPRTNRSGYKPAIFTEDLSIQSEDSSDVINESLPKVYSKVRFDNDRRLSLYAKVVGERAEKIVIKYLAEILMPNERDSIKWISKSGETPGWDIEYYDSTNKIVAIEVKGTNGKNFPNVEITGNEWNAAIELGDQYWIYLVSDCLGTNPKIQRLQNPLKLKETGWLRTTPILWRIEMITSDVV